MLVNVWCISVTRDTVCWIPPFFFFFVWNYGLAMGIFPFVSFFFLNVEISVASLVRVHRVQSLSSLFHFFFQQKKKLLRGLVHATCDLNDALTFLHHAEKKATSISLEIEREKNTQGVLSFKFWHPTFSPLLRYTVVCLPADIFIPASQQQQKNVFFSLVFAFVMCGRGLLVGHWIFSPLFRCHCSIFYLAILENWFVSSLIVHRPFYKITSWGKLMLFIICKVTGAHMLSFRSSCILFLFFFFL